MSVNMIFYVLLSQHILWNQTEQLPFIVINVFIFLSIRLYFFHKLFVISLCISSNVWCCCSNTKNLTFRFRSMQIGFLYDDFDEVFNGFKVSAGTPLLLILCNLAGIGILALLLLRALFLKTWFHGMLCIM